MIVCKVGDPIAVDGWKPFLKMEGCAAPPAERVTPEQPGWSESVIERSLLRHPKVLAKALGARAPFSDIQALRQVANIDLYLRLGGDLHLLEVKKPTEHTKWRYGAEEVTRQWCASAVWLRRGVASVHLWAVIPVRWSRRKGTAKIPSDWRATLAEIRKQLTGLAAAELGLLFYVIVQSPSQRYLVLWRADEPVPGLNVRGPRTHADQ